MAIAITSKGGLTDSTGLNSTETLPSGSVAAGSTVLVAVAYDQDTQPSSATDVTFNGVALTLQNKINTPSTGHTCEIWTLENAGAATATPLVEFDTPSPDFVAEWYEITGAATASYDKEAAAQGSSSSPSSGATATTAQAAELWFGAIATQQTGSPTGTWSNSFTALQGRGDGVVAISTGYKIVAATGAATAAKTSAGTHEWAALVSTFKEVLDQAVTLGVATMAMATPALTAAAGAVSIGLGAPTMAMAAPALGASGSLNVGLGVALMAMAAPAIDARNDREWVLASGGLVAATENPEIDIRTGYTESLLDSIQRRSQSGVSSKGFPYFAAVQLANLDGVAWLGGGGFEMRLTLTLRAMPEALASVDELHRLFSLHEIGGRPLLEVGVTPNGRVGCVTPENGVTLSAPGVIGIDHHAHEIYLLYGALDGDRYLFFDGVEVARGIGPHNFLDVADLIFPVPRDGYQARVMLFNGQEATTKCACAIHRAVIKVEGADYVWPLTDCSIGTLTNIVIDPPIIDSGPPPVYLDAGPFALEIEWFAPDASLPWGAIPEGNVRRAYDCLNRSAYRRASVVPPSYRREGVNPGDFTQQEEP